MNWRIYIMSIRAFVAEILIKIFSVFPIEKKAVFSSYYGKYNNDSPMALYEEIRINLYG